jgi:hypothetical protein
MNVRIACPNCRASNSFPVNGNVLDTPLVCHVCGQLYSPHFYCPEARSPARHIFAATALNVDNSGAVYAFCPVHTLTTYALAADSKPRPRRSPLRSLSRFLDSLVFRLALSVEALRWHTFSRR